MCVVTLLLRTTCSTEGGDGAVCRSLPPAGEFTPPLTPPHRRAPLRRRLSFPGRFKKHDSALGGTPRAWAPTWARFCANTGKHCAFLRFLTAGKAQNVEPD